MTVRRQFDRARAYARYPSQRGVQVPMKANGNVKKPHTRYLRMVRNVQDEFSKQYIHEGLKPSEVRKRILAKPGGYIADGTVKRFLRYGRGAKQMTYIRGPFATTVFAVAEALGFKVNVTREEK